MALSDLARQRRERPEARRQVLVLLSDGIDTASHVTADDVARMAGIVGVNIYVIALAGPKPESQQRRNMTAERAAYELRALARDSGGRMFRPTTALELPATYEAIARELASQYDLAYLPTRLGADGFRRVAVRVLRPRKRRRAPAAVTAVERTGFSKSPPRRRGRTDEHLMKAPLLRTIVAVMNARRAFRRHSLNSNGRSRAADVAGERLGECEQLPCLSEAGTAPRSTLSRHELPLTPRQDHDADAVPWSPPQFLQWDAVNRHDSKILWIDLKPILDVLPDQHRSAAGEPEMISGNAGVGVAFDDDGASCKGTTVLRKTGV